VKISSNISYEEFLAFVEKYEKAVVQWSFGQAYFNILTSVRPQLAELIRGTIHDPYHKDVVSDQTHEYVKSKWDSNA
jgi:hypothetical protein